MSDQITRGEREELWRAPHIRNRYERGYEAALTAAEARIRELEEALRPFALAADAADRKAAESARLGMGSMSDNASTGLGITFGHCRRARAALSQEKK